MTFPHFAVGWAHAADTSFQWTKQVASHFGGLERFTVSSEKPLAAGRRTIRYDFTPDHPKPGSGGISRLSIDNQEPTEARVARTMPFVYSADEGIDVSTDNETPVTEDYQEGDNHFTGTIHKVTVELS